MYVTNQDNEEIDVLDLRQRPAPVELRTCGHIRQGNLTFCSYFLAVDSRGNVWRLRLLAGVFRSSEW